MNFNPQEHYTHALQAYQSGQFPKAERLLNELLQHFPKQDAIMSTLGAVLVASGKGKEACRLLEKVLKLNPKNIDAWINLSAAQKGRGRLKEALKSIQQASKLKPKRADIFYNEANILLDMKAFKEAETSYKKTIALNPQLYSAHFNLGEVYRMQNFPQKAKSAYQKALAIKADFAPALSNLGNITADEGGMEAATNLYRRAIKAAPNNVETYLLLGKHLFDQGANEEAKEVVNKAVQLDDKQADAFVWLGNIAKAENSNQEAEYYYQKALELEPQHEAAIRNLRRIWHGLIPMWHFTMLADTQRNIAYQKAIEKAIDEDSVVLDIGTGSGLLAMMAARAGAKEIIACEMHSQLAETAKEIIALNKYSDQIKVLNKKSTFLKSGVDLPDHTNVLISEILDVGVLGEGALPSIRHAVKMLLQPGAIIIPAKVKLYGALLEIPGRSAVVPVRSIAGFDLSPMDRFRIPDEYMTVHLKMEKHRFLSEVVPLIEYDFYNLPPAIQDNEPARKAIQLPIIHSGRAEAMIFWFDLYTDESTKVSSKPDGELNHWGQALYCFSKPQEVKAGQQKEVQMLHSDQLIRFAWPEKD